MSGRDSRPVLVTGGAGFIGSHLVDALIAAGRRVRVLDDFSTGLHSNLDQARATGALTVIEGSLLDRARCAEACDGAAVVYHQAALGSVPRSLEDPARSVEVNVTGTANLFTAARDAGIERVVYASSSSVYGDSDRLPKREGEEGRPLSPYAATKCMNEQLAAVFGSSFGMGFVGLRYFNVFGPRQRPDGPYAAVVPRFFDAYVSGQAPRIHGDGRQSRDFTFVADAVQANLLASQAPAEACGRAYNVGCSGRTTVLELAEAIRACVGGGPAPEHGPPRAGDVRHSLASLEAAEEALGYRPSHDLADGLASTWAALRQPARTDPSS